MIQHEVSEIDFNMLRRYMACAEAVNLRTHAVSIFQQYSSMIKAKVSLGLQHILSCETGAIC